MQPKFTADYDAVVVGSGPNGLAAAIRLQQQGLSVLLVEARKTIGGGMRTAELTLPGFHHDICSTVHPLGASSPFFSTLPLAEHGLRWLEPAVAAAHPLGGETGGAFYKSIAQTAAGLGQDGNAYRQLMEPLLREWPKLAPQILGPLRLPTHPLTLARFGLRALLPASMLARWQFSGEPARALWAGMAAHAIQPLERITTSAISLALMTAGHACNWPVPAGGAASLTRALAAYFTSLGGEIMTDFPVSSLQQLPAWRVLLLDLTPRQLLELKGVDWSALYRWQLRRFRYGMGAFKVDWALAEPAPFRYMPAREAVTVHVGGTFDEIKATERQIHRGKHPERPLVLYVQASIIDPSRAPAGQHTGWAYCHVPNGSLVDCTDRIEAQLERFAPGFRERILARHVMNTADLQVYNPNYIGGDINGGEQRPDQIFTRPALRWSPYRTSARGIYICSSSTPPGGGVHGMCGFHAAERALQDEFY